MRTTRLRQKIKKFLDERGEANTTEILEHVLLPQREVEHFRGDTKYAFGRFDPGLWKKSPDQSSRS